MTAVIIPEKDVQAACLQWLNTLPDVKVWRRNVGAVKSTHNGKSRFIRFGESGMSDLWGIGPGGIHIECEIKSVGNRPTAAQFGWIWECHAMGGIGFWADSLDMCAKELRSQFIARNLPWRERWMPQ